MEMTKLKKKNVKDRKKNEKDRKKIRQKSYRN